MITEELKNKVKEIFKNSNLNPNTIRIILLKNKELFEQLNEQFKTKPDIYVSVNKLVILIVKNIQLKHCKVCGKQMNYDMTLKENGYYCSNKCKLTGSQNPFAKAEVKQKIKKTMQMKYGKDNAAQVQSIKQKMKKTNLQKYNNSF